MFTWIPIYAELAEKLLAYRDRQKELLGMIDELKNEGLQPVGTKDKASWVRSVPQASANFANSERARFCCLSSLLRALPLINRRNVGSRKI